MSCLFHSDSNHLVESVNLRQELFLFVVLRMELLEGIALIVLNRSDVVLVLVVLFVLFLHFLELGSGEKLSENATFCIDFVCVKHNFPTITN